MNNEGYYGSASTTIAVGVGLPITSDSTKLTSGTYAVNDNLEITERIKIDGNVKLILSAGKTLTASKGIDVDTGNSLTIEGEGTLIAKGEEKNSGIGGSIGGGADRTSGTITINSGTVTATGGDYAAGIGGACNENSPSACHNGTVIINGGVVTANGGKYAAGIGGGAGESNNGGNGGVMTINGGQVVANAGTPANGYTSYGMGPGGVYQSDRTEGAAATITLGWTDSANDFIQATSYKTASFADGKVFVLENTNTVATESNLSGKKLVPYIQPVTNIDSAVISGVDALYHYSESGITITPTVTLLETTLTAGTDYIISYELNGNAVDAVKDIGTYTLTVNGTGDYTGSLSTTFRVVHAKTAINYQAYESGELKDKTLSADGYTCVTNETTAMTGGWYVVQDDFTVSDRISVTGNVNLVLCDGATLTAEKGIGVTDGNSLTIYSQSGNTGGITATNSDNYFAGIGGNRDGGFNSAVKSGTITIHGGVINATGSYGSAGIGAAYGGAAGSITIYSGKVTATGGNDGTGIGGSGATIHLGWCRSDSDFIEANGYEGSITFDKVFVLNGTSTTATASNSGGQKIVPTTATTHTVTFDSNGGSEVAEQNVVSGQATPEPGKPMKQGYRFAGWYAAQDFTGSAYDFSAAVTSSFTLYAKWEEVSEISYIGTDGRTVSTSEYTPLESSYTTLSAGTFYVGADTTISNRITVSGTVNLILGDGKTLTASKGINVPSGATLNVFCQSAGTGTLTTGAEENNAAIGANYKQSTSGTIHIYGGVITATGGVAAAAIGGGNDGSNGAVYIYGGTVTANGGDYAAAIGGGQFGNGGTISVLGGKVTANAGTVYGTGIGADSVNSTAKTATITLGYKTADDFIQATIYCGTVTVKSGKMFQTDASTQVDVSGSVSEFSTINNKKLTPKKCTVTFDLGGATGTAPDTQSGLLYGIDKAEKPTDPFRTGYTFKEWQLSGTAYDFSTLVTGDITLAAAWTANSYTVCFNGNGATGGSMSDQNFTYDMAQNLTANAFTAPTGYHFTGWNTQADGNGTAYADEAEVNNLTAEDGATVTLYAQWSLTDYTVTVADSITNGTVTADKTTDAHYGDTVTLTVTPNAGYELGMLKVTGASGAVTTTKTNDTTYTFTMPAEDVTVSATFAKLPITTYYVEANSTEHIEVQAIPLDATMTTLKTGTYVVNSNVEISGNVNISGDVKLILADDCTLNISNEGTGATAIYSDGSLTFYGQQGQSGKLAVTVMVVIAPV